MEGEHDAAGLPSGDDLLHRFESLPYVGLQKELDFVYPVFSQRNRVLLSEGEGDLELVAEQEVLEALLHALLDEGGYLLPDFGKVSSSFVSLLEGVVCLKPRFL